MSVDRCASLTPSFLYSCELSSQEDVPQLIASSLVNKHFFNECVAKNPIIHSESFAARFGEMRGEACGDELKALIEVFRRGIVGTLLIEGKGYKGVYSSPLIAPPQFLRFLSSFDILGCQDGDRTICINDFQVKDHDAVFPPFPASIEGDSHKIRLMRDDFIEQWNTDCTIAYEDGTTYLASRSSVIKFVAYLYCEKDPFDIEDGKEVPELSTNPFDLYLLAKKYDLKNLMNMCARRMVNMTTESEWRSVADSGEYLRDEFVLKVCEHDRLRRGECLPSYVQKVFEEMGLEMGKRPAQDVFVICDVGYGNALGIRFAEDSPELAGISWNMTKEFRYEEGKWVGTVPTNKEFKFVRIFPSGEIQWEKWKNRCLSEDSNYRLMSRTVQFEE